MRGSGRDHPDDALGAIRGPITVAFAHNHRMRSLLAGLFLLAIFGCAKPKPPPSIPTASGATNFVTTDAPKAPALRGAIYYEEPMFGLEINVAEGWKSFGMTAVYTAMRKANPNVGPKLMNLMQNDQMKLMDYRDASVQGKFIPSFRVNAFDQRSTSLDDAVQRFLAGAKNMGNPDPQPVNFSIGKAMHWTSAGKDFDLLGKETPVIHHFWVFATASTVYVAESTFTAGQEAELTEIQAMVESFRPRVRDPKATFGKPPMPDADPDIRVNEHPFSYSGGSPGMNMRGFPRHDPTTELPQTLPPGTQPPVSPPTTPDPTPNDSGGGSPPADPPPPTSGGSDTGGGTTG